MKMSFKFMAAIAAFSCLAILAIASPEIAHAANHATFLNLTPSIGDLWQASPALLALRSDLGKLKKKAKDKEAEITDDLDDEQLRGIQEEHEDLLRQIEEKEGEIAALEAEESTDPASDPNTGNRSDLTAAQAADIMSIGRRAGMDQEDVEAAIRSNTPVEDFRSQAFDFMADATRSTETEPNRRTSTQIQRDERETRRNALQEAMSYRMGVPVPDDGPSDAAREFMEYRGISSFAAEAIGFEGRLDSMRAMDDLYERAAHTTSDFPAIFEGAVNRTLEQRYALAIPTYRRIARRSDFRDFRPHTTVKIGDFPMLKKVAEDGEIKYGTFSEGKELTQAFAYARALSITRQMLVNDDLNAIGDLLSSYGETIALFEEIMFYSTALEGKLADNKAVYHADHSNLAGSGTAITVAAISNGRKSLSKQKSLEGNPLLSNKARILLCGPDKITEAEQIVTTITANETVKVNPFSGKLEPVETAQIDGNAWYMLPDAAAGQASNYRWGLLQGYEAPRVRMDEPFGRQGMAMSVEHDFGTGATDYRFGYKNPGA